MAKKLDSKKLDSKKAAAKKGTTGKTDSSHPAPKAVQGILVSLEDRGDDMLGMVMDTVARKEGSSDEWVFQKNLVTLNHPIDLMENLQLSRRELAEIGETMMIWLLSRAGRLN